MKATTNIPQLLTPCLFSGKVEGDSESKVFVSGCYNSSETLASIVSSQLPGGILDLYLVNGITSNVTTEVDQRGRTGSLDYVNTERINDALFRPKTRVPSASFSGPLPSKVILKTDIKYDNSLLKHFSNSHQRTKNWINKIVGLTQIRMYHDTIKMKVTIKVGTVSHIDDSFKADLEDFKKLLKKRKPRLTSYFCEDIGGTSTVGFAYIGAACSRAGYAINVVELHSRVNTDISSAKTFAHELGHTIGMQ